MSIRMSVVLLVEQSSSTVYLLLESLYLPRAADLRSASTRQELKDRASWSCNKATQQEAIEVARAAAENLGLEIREEILLPSA